VSTTPASSRPRIAPASDARELDRQLGLGAATAAVVGKVIFLDNWSGIYHTGCGEEKAKLWDSGGVTAKQTLNDHFTVMTINVCYGNRSIRNLIRGPQRARFWREGVEERRVCNAVTDTRVIYGSRAIRNLIRGPQRARFWRGGVEERQGL